MEKQCEKIRENIQGYFERSLSKQVYENTEKHLQECPDCSWFFREYEKMDELLLKWEVSGIPENFEEKVIEAVNDKEIKKNRSFLFSFINPAVAGLTALLVLIILSLVYYFSLPVIAGQGREVGDKILFEEGPVFPLKTGAEIHAKNSDLELLLNDGSLIRLSKGARFTINNFSHKKKSCTIAGELKAIIQKYPGQEFTIKTDSGEIVVLGTGFIVSAMKFKTIVSVFDGSVAVKGRTEKTQLTKGNITVLSLSSRFVNPVSALDALKDRDKNMRIQAIKTLVEIRGKEEIQGVITLLNDADETVRAEAALDLGLPGAGSKEAVKPLLKALRDKDKIVRMNAAVSLGKLRAMDAREPLKWLAGDKEIEGRTGGALGLSYLGEKSYGVEAVVKDLDSKDAKIRYKAVKLLGRIGTEKQSLKIAEKIKDPEKDIRWYALRALERLNDPKTFPALAEALKDPDPDIKKKALQTVSNVFYSDAAGDVVFTITDTSSREMKFAAIRTLGYLLMTSYRGDKGKQVELLERCMNDRDRLIKVAALTAYARAAGTDSAQKVYEVSVKDGNKIMKETAAEILKIIKKQDFRFNLRPVEIRAFGKLKEKAVIPVLLTASKDWNPSTREAAMTGFENLNDKIYLPLLFEGMKDSDFRVSEAAEEAVRVLNVQ